MPAYLLRKLIRKLPGMVIKAVRIPQPQIIEGYGARGKVGDLCTCRSVLLVTDRTLFGLGYHQAVAESLERAGIRYAVFSDIASEPTTEIIANGREAALACQAECIVALGGGSVMDACKMIAAGGRLKRLNVHLLLLKFLFVPGKTLPLINIPSTAGTGAELTVGALVTDTATHSKGSTVIVGLNIQSVILDSELTVNAPAKVTAACGIDALSHGLEGCVADIRSSRDDLGKSRECVRLVLTNLPQVLAHPNDVQARQAMCRAALYGGNAINQQLAGYVHAFAHSIGAMYHIPHGNAIAACLLPVMVAQQEVCTAQLAQLARCCGLCQTDVSDAEASEVLLRAIGELIRTSGALSEHLDMPDADLRRLTRKICWDSINYSPPKTFTDNEIRQIIWNIRSQA